MVAHLMMQNMDHQRQMLLSTFFLQPSNPLASLQLNFLLYLQYFHHFHLYLDQIQPAKRLKPSRFNSLSFCRTMLPSSKCGSKPTPSFSTNEYDIGSGSLEVSSDPNYLVLLFGSKTTDRNNKLQYNN